jgi:polyhydroxyalkanoate synthesis regulator phasin
MKKKVLVIVLAALAVITALVFVVPVFAESASPTVAASQITPANKPGALIRLLLVQDEAKVDAYIAQAVEAGKITADQAVKVKDFWTAHHKQFAWNFVLRRLLRAQNENNVKTYLDKAVANGKITQVQADKIIAIWEILHAPAPAAAP